MDITTLQQALDLCAHTSPMPVAAGQALRILRTHLECAQAIADRCVRSEIEFHAHSPSRGFFDLSRVSEDAASEPEAKNHIAAAIDYIALRGDALPFRIVVQGHPQLVSFQDGPRRCRICGCTDARACPGGCAWGSANLCTACLPGVCQTITVLALVSGTEHITDAMVDAWTADERADAYHWAMAVHYYASDNDDVIVPVRPPHTMPSAGLPT